MSMGLGCTKPLQNQATVCVETADSCLTSAKLIFLEYETRFLSYIIPTARINTLCTSAKAFVRR